MLLEAMTMPFFQRVLLAGILASIACGILGSYVVAKRMASLAGSLAHAAFGGVGLGYWLGFSPLLGALGFGVAAGVGTGVAARRLGAGFDTWISMAWAVGMALGIVFVSLAPGYAPDLMSYLFGSLLFVSWDYVAAVALLDLGILLLVGALFRPFQAVAFDEEFAEASGLPVERLRILMLALTSAAIVTLIRVVGVILVIALLTIPAAIGRHWAHALARMMAIAVGVSVLCTVAGLFLSYALSEWLDVAVPTGPLIVLLGVLAYAVSALLRWAASPSSSALSTSTT